MAFSVDIGVFTLFIGSLDRIVSQQTEVAKT